MSVPRALTVAVLALTLAASAGCGGGDGQAKGSRPAVPAACKERPSADNTGSSGHLKASSTTVLNDGERLTNARVQGLEIRGKDVRVRNVTASDGIFVTGDDATIDHVSTAGIAVSSASGTRISHSQISASTEDGIHLTSDRGRTVSDVRLTYNYVHSPRPPEDGHYDGLQVRGIDGLLVSCSVFDAGPYRPQYNAGIYLEDANGGDRNVVVANNWVLGSGYSVMVDAPGTVLTGNQVGGETHWGPCDLGREVQRTSLVDKENLVDGRRGALCTESAARG